MSRLPLRVIVDEPCFDPDVSFEERDGVRHCLSCDAPQYDLRRATEREARALFAAHGGRLCAQFVVNEDGHATFRPDPPSGSAALARGALMALSLAACDRASSAEGPSASPPSSPGVTVEPMPAGEVPGAVAPPSADLPGAPIAEPVGTVPADPHATDASTDPAHHEEHAHTHAPVGIGVLLDDGHDGRPFELSGGARAVGPPMAPQPIVTVRRVVAEDAAHWPDVVIVTRLLRRRVALLRSTYERALAEQPDRAGVIELRLTLDEQGRFEPEAEVTRDTLQLPEVTTLAVRLGRIAGPVPATVEGEAVFAVTLNFAPAP
jgi:hypothetical protein